MHRIDLGVGGRRNGCGGRLIRVSPFAHVKQLPARDEKGTVEAKLGKTNARVNECIQRTLSLPKYSGVQLHAERTCSNGCPKTLMFEPLHTLSRDSRHL
jgi:hypothetical protein